MKWLCKIFGHKYQFYKRQIRPLDNYLCGTHAYVSSDFYECKRCKAFYHTAWEKHEIY